MTQSEIAEICSLRSGQFIRSGDFGYILDKGKIAHVWVSDAKRRTDFSQLVSQLSAFLINEQREPDKDYGAYWVAITLQEMAKSQEYTFVECTDPAHGGFIIFGGRIGPGKTPRTRWWWPFGSKVAAGKDRLETLRKEKEDAIEELKLAIGMGSGLDAHAIEEIVTAAVDHLDVGVKKPVDLVPEKDRPETLGKEDGIQPADPGFEWLKDAIWGKKWDEMPIEEIVTRLLGILRQDRKCKRALDECALFVHGNIKRLGFEMAGNRLLDPIFAQCDECSACWVPAPAAKHVAGNIVLNPVGICCKRCNRVLCRQCYAKLDQTSSCSKCGKQMAPVVEANGRTRPATNYYD